MLTLLNRPADVYLSSAARSVQPGPRLIRGARVLTLVLIVLGRCPAAWSEDLRLPVCAMAHDDALENAQRDKEADER